MKARIGVEARMLHKVHIFNAVLLSALFAAAWYVFSWPLAMSVMIGGLLASVSFVLLSRDITKLMESVTRAGTNNNSIKKIAKVRLLFNFYLRLGVIALVLYVLNERMPIHMIGLAVGLSTVMLSIVIVVLSKGSMLYSAQRIKGA
jgi:hypothetical protein